jgi:hypothetical protein
MSEEKAWLSWFVRSQRRHPRGWDELGFGKKKIAGVATVALRNNQISDYQFVIVCGVCRQADHTNSSELRDCSQSFFQWGLRETHRSS